MNWGTVHAPDLDAFAQLARAAFERLPAAFRDKCADVLVMIEDEPDQEVMAEMGLESPYELLGLYRGVDLTRKSVLDASAEPDLVTLYRRPILDVWADGDNTLGHLVTHVLIHEIGHHFGLSDEDMEALEAEAERDAVRQPDDKT